MNTTLPGVPGFRRARRELRRLAWKLGYDVRRADGPTESALRVVRVCEHLGVSRLVDAGAHNGTWAAAVRSSGYRGRISSFEPHPVVFAELAARAGADSRWDAHQIALGAAAAKLDLRVTSDSTFSSFRNQDLKLLETSTISVQSVEVERLDELVPFSDQERLFVKLDVQGYELEVVRGAARIIDLVVATQVEVLLRPLYSGQPTLVELVETLAATGLRPAGVFNGAVTQSGEENYFDVLFVR